jgi:DNA processing protein
LARGIDTHAHRGALAAKGITVGVMACGFRNFYPAENKDLADQISEKGCIISEFPTYVPPLSQNFPRRNRLISGLSLGVVVVEAAHRSGSLITADFALEQGRSVFAVPGRIDSPSSSGTLGLLKEGAKMVQTVDDILEELEILNPSLASPGQNSDKLPVNQDEKAVLDLIGSDPLSVDEISRRMQMETSKVLSLLFNLELRRLVKQLPGKYYVKTLEN